MTSAAEENVNATLLLIDVQNDFHPGGSLAIKSADEDAKRIADIIRRGIENPTSPLITRLVATMDSHHKLHIAHATFWVNDDNEHPPPFTIITSSDIEKGIWKPRKNLKLPVRNQLVKPLYFKQAKYDIDGNLKLLEYCIEYTRLLEEKGKFKLCIWPEHCLIGTKGHQIVDQVSTCMTDWSDKTGGSIEWVMKGENLLTEMYSALAAEVPITAQTDYNIPLLHSLKKSDRLLIVGQAMSHCVNYTTRDIVERWPKNELHKIRVITDCMSPVEGFQKEADQFLNFLEHYGIRTCSAEDAFKSDEELNKEEDPKELITYE